MTTEHSGSGDLNRSMALLWGVQDKATRGPRPGLSLDRIVSVAIEVADAEGLEAVSMRRIASELGVGTMSLYRHVPGKGELLDLMLDKVSGLHPGEQGAFAGLSRREVLEHMARGFWQLYTGHPWLLAVDQARPILGPNGLDGFELALEGLHGIPLSSRQQMNLINSLDALVSGIARNHVNAQQATERTGVSDEEFWEAQRPALEKAMQSGRYPRIFALDADAFSATGPEVLEFALRCFLDGVEAQFTSEA